jgi:hypothetical protein
LNSRKFRASIAPPRTSNERRENVIFSKKCPFFPGKWSPSRGCGLASSRCPLLPKVAGRDSPPCTTARRGGCVINKFREATEADAAGVVFLVVLKRKTTPASRSRTLRDILLIARPPLLAVVQGGESLLVRNVSDIFHSSRDRAFFPRYGVTHCAQKDVKRAAPAFIFPETLQPACPRMRLDPPTNRRWRRPLPTVHAQTRGLPTGWLPFRPGSPS